MNDVLEEIMYRLPRLIANVSITLAFAGMSYIVLWTLSDISTEIVFLLQIGLLLAAGIFLVRTLFDALDYCRQSDWVIFETFGHKGRLV